MEKKFDKLIDQMTLVEKASMLAGVGMWHTVPVERLGIPAIKLTDGPNGARGVDDIIGPTSICFPVGVAMGATWNLDLIKRVGAALAGEAKAKSAHVLLAPTVNIQRTPIAGRNFECFAEDPFLSGMMAAAYIIGLQNEGVSACIKHFVTNDQEFERFSISSEVAERPLHEIYLEPFRIVIQQANPWSIMSAYNRINGVHASENDVLLRDILKEKWAYDGAVISDWYGTYSSGVSAGGLDLEMPGPGRFMAADIVVAAVESGELDEAMVDDKVRRLLRLIDRVGAFDNPGFKPETSNDNPADRALARQVAAEAIVLLKNENQILPLDLEQVKTIAVIGENAKWAQIMGGGSSAVNPHYAISPLEGIQNRVGTQATVSYEIGTPIHRRPPLLDMGWVTAVDGQTNGLTLEYFDNLELAGVATKTAVIRKTFLSWFGTINPYVDPTNFSLRLSGILTVPDSRSYDLQLAGVGRSRLLLDGVVQIDNWRDNPSNSELSGSVTLELSAGQPYQLVVEYSTNPTAPWRMVRLGCPLTVAEDPIQAAVDLAAQSDVAIVVAGLTHEWESEGFDRPDMALVGQQNELIARVAAVNPNTVVILNVGSPVIMPWLADVPAALQSWYLGQESGNALADVLFGDVNPSGKLPITLPQRLEDNPAFINYPGENDRVLYGEGIFVGYRYYDKKGIVPLFPFGHGLSYTTFAYNNLQLNGDSFGPGDQILVSVDVTNTGARIGQEVVQLYVCDEQARMALPFQELKAFAKVRLEPGETKTVTLELDHQRLAFYDTAVHDWVTESGQFELKVGRSSRDIRLQGRFTWVEGTAVSSSEEKMAQFSTVPT
ncbi:MAG: beta-glucosidase [Chloroflexi bacterium]|nr:beta-glucosidase [Chloroflexota bacterium]